MDSPGTIDTCADYDWCDGHLELPEAPCFLDTCAVLYDGINNMTLKYLTEPDFLVGTRPQGDFRYVGLLPIDFPGHELIDAIIDANFANTPPEARCKDVTVPVGASCQPAPASIDNGSFDLEDLTASCVQTPAGPYAAGTTAVTLVCTDYQGETASCTGNVVASDQTPPTLLCPSGIDVQCSSNQSANVSFVAAASDNCTAFPIASCPTAGTLFPLGSTTASCQASDAAGNQGTCSFSVNVGDTVAPSIQCPAAQTVECTGSQHASAAFSATSSDACWGALTPQCTPASGSSFALGTTPISCGATDGSGNPATCTSQATVADTAAPAITCPADIALDPTGPTGTNVTFAASATDICDATPQVACSPVSGTLFGVGTQTSVACTATDVSLNRTSCSFGVRVFSPQEVVANLRAYATALGARGALDRGQTNSLLVRLRNISRSMQNDRSAAACGQLQGLASGLNDRVEDGTLSAADAQPMLTSNANLQATLSCR